MTKCILVVEDQEDLRGILRDLLTGSGYDVAVAADGRDGVAKALSDRPDLFLMDIQLPVIDGYEATLERAGRVKEETNCGERVTDCVLAASRRVWVKGRRPPPRPHPKSFVCSSPDCRREVGGLEHLRLVPEAVISRSFSHLVG